MDVSAQLPVIGIDPGARWTGAVLRIGDRSVTGWTFGPIDVDGSRAYDAIDDVDDLAAMARYIDRITSAVADLEKLGEEMTGRTAVIALEAIVVPIDWKARRPGRIAIRDWLNPRQVVIGILAVYPGAVLVSPAGVRPTSEYPAQLRKTPPEGWGPVESRRRERDHERAAYDVAGVVLDHLGAGKVAA